MFALPAASMAISTIQGPKKFKSSTSGEKWGKLGSTMAALMLVWSVYKTYFPSHIVRFRNMLNRLIDPYINPYIRIRFPEFAGEGFYQYKTAAFKAIERYLHKKSSDQAKYLKAGFVRDSDAIVLSMEDNEEVTDEFEGVKVWWASGIIRPSGHTTSILAGGEERRHFKLTFHRKHREIVTKEYLNHVLKEGKKTAIRQRRRKLYTNCRNENVRIGCSWSHVTFEHPATFDTLAMDSRKKQEIMDDLENFRKSKEYYAKIGKAWKRGYLLYGPPGTGKSTMIAAMANFLNYDVYDLELTSVRDNSELRKLLIDTSGSSIIVIEDIDCSLDLTGQREKTNTTNADKTKKVEENKKISSSQVTLSGLLNFIDGLWSACGGERLIVFTTNHVENLDPALIRRGRMDKHIELSYCGFEAFKVLANIYLNLESHDLFDEVGNLLEEIKMTPADVAENLMPKSTEEDADFCVKRLIKALEQAKEDARLKAEEEERLKKERLKAEKEEKKKQKQDKADSSEKSAETMAKAEKEENKKQKQEADSNEKNAETMKED